MDKRTKTMPENQKVIPTAAHKRIANQGLGSTGSNMLLAIPAALLLAVSNTIMYESKLEEFGWT